MYLYLDIETVADGKIRPELLNDMLDRVKGTTRTSAEDKQAKLVSSFSFMPLTNQVICVGISTDKDDSVKCIMSKDEGEVIRELAVELERLQNMYFEPIHSIVTYNGKSFDIPVLMVKCMKHGVHIPCIVSAFLESKYRAEKNVDMRDILTSWGEELRGTQKQWGLYFGLTIPDNGDGSEIQGMWNEGKFDEIQAKNNTDIDVLKELHQRWLIATGCMQ
jgi:predicted PolB exonuclease-like 3'-5' exonuclease